jgi:tryptophan synthase alpha chain
MDGAWLDVLAAISEAGADAIEIGLPFSDPMVDGPVIQRASQQALARGVTPASVLADVRRSEAGVPLVVMTYYNLVFRMGERRMASSLEEAGISGAVVPDLPLEECGTWCAEADSVDLATVLLVAPSTPRERAARICDRSRGFLYAVGRMGVTGEQSELAASAIEVAGTSRALTDLPVLVGIGVSTPGQAAQACEAADGVVVGSALVRRLLDGGGPEGAAKFVGELRAALDGARSAGG